MVRKFIHHAKWALHSLKDVRKSGRTGLKGDRLALDWTLTVDRRVFPLDNSVG